MTNDEYEEGIENTKYVVYMYAEDMEELQTILNASNRMRVPILDVTDMNYYERKRFKEESPHA